MGARLGKLSDDDLKQMFQEFDRNGDGVIDEEELRLAIASFGLPASSADVRRLMNLIDLNQSNDIDFSEFCYFMKVSSFWFQTGVPGRSHYLFMNATAETATKTLVAGGIAGAISRSSVAPLERLKIIFQTQPHPPKYTGVLQAMKLIYAEEGLLGFFKGNGTNVIRIVPASAIQFFSYEQYKRLIFGNQDLGPLQRLLAGGMTGITALVATYPLELVRARLSIQAGRTRNELAYKGMWHGLNVIAKKEGFLALYKGMWPSLVGVVPYVGIDFAAYETFKDYVPRQPDGTVKRIHTLACGGLAGTIAQTVAYPLDLIRRRMQVQGFNQNYGVEYNGMTDAFLKIYRTEGLLGFYRGLWPNYLKVVPALSISFLAFEEMKQVFSLSTPASGKQKTPT
ncbi:hypothetical protein QOT17_019044 [Balamuthia mandrillaris]